MGARNLAWATFIHRLDVQCSTLTHLEEFAPFFFFFFSFFLSPSAVFLLDQSGTGIVWPFGFLFSPSFPLSVFSISAYELILGGQIYGYRGWYLVLAMSFPRCGGT